MSPRIPPHSPWNSCRFQTSPRANPYGAGGGRAAENVNINNRIMIYLFFSRFGTLDNSVITFDQSTDWKTEITTTNQIVDDTLFFFRGTGLSLVHSRSISFFLNVRVIQKSPNRFTWEIELICLEVELKSRLDIDGEISLDFTFADDMAIVTETIGEIAQKR